MCLPACLWAQIARTPFNNTITTRTLLAKRLTLQFPAPGKNYCIANMFIISRTLRTRRDLERRESGSMFCETNHFLKFERIKYKASKYSAEKYRDQNIKFTRPAVGLTPFYPWVCLHLTFLVRTLILRCLTGSHVTISSEPNYCVRLTVNVNIADSISSYFNFGKGY